MKIVFSMPCTKGVKNGAHMGSGILARGGGLQLPKALYGHDDSTCPDLKDSVYLTPTSDNPFDPLPIACALGQMKRGSPQVILKFLLDTFIKNYSKVERMSGVHIISILMLKMTGLKSGKNKRKSMFYWLLIRPKIGFFLNF